MFLSAKEMKKLFFINETLENKISCFLLGFFLVALPFQHFFSEIVLSCFTIHILIHLRKRNLQTLENKISCFLLGFFLVALPFQHFFSEIVLSCFTIHILIHLRKRNLQTLKN